MSDNQRTNQHRGSGAGMGFVAVIVGLIFIVGPIAAASYISSVSQLMLMGFGVVSLVIGAVVITITKLYVKATTYAGFIRTGLGGKKVVVDGGALVIPAVHEIAWVPFETLTIKVMRTGKDALITKDNLRADAEAEFFVKVKKEEKDMLTASAALGEGSLTAEKAKSLCESTCISALRAVAVQMTLTELNTERDQFKVAVAKLVTAELAEKGFTLDSVAVPKLDQSPLDVSLAESNIFDAQGARTIAAIVQEQRVARNQLQQDAELALKQKNVETAKQMEQQEVELANFKAEQELAKKNAAAKTTQEAEKYAAEQRQLSETARVLSDQTIEVAGIERDKVKDVAEQTRQKAVREAEIAKEKALAVAGQQKAIEIANKEKERAEAEAEQLKAEEQREKNRQAVETVTVTQTAEREKQKAVIAKQAITESQQLELKMQADTKAYQTEREAEAEKKAAEARASAKTTAAEASKTAALLEAEASKATKLMSAEGQKALEMVPVEVARAQVEVDRQELENKAQFDTISRQLTVDLAKIAAEKEVRVAFAGALGQVFMNSKMTIWGDPATLERVSKMFTEGQAYGSFMSGLADTTPEKVQEVVKETIKGVGTTVKGLMGTFTGTDEPLQGERISE